MANTWMNSDNLYIKFGTAEGTVAAGGQILDTGPYRMVEIPVTGTAIVANPASGAGIVHDTVVIPKNARIDKVEVVATTLMNSAGNGAVLNVGLVKASDRSTEVDYDGLVAALAETSMDPAGDYQTIDVNHAKAGALLGTTTAFKSLVSVDYDTEAFTSGAIKIRIYYYMTA